MSVSDHAHLSVSDHAHLSVSDHAHLSVSDHAHLPVSDHAHLSVSDHAHLSVSDHACRIEMHLAKIKTKFKYYLLGQTVTLLNLLYDIWLAILMKKGPFFAVIDILIIFSTIAPRCKLRM